MSQQNPLSGYIRKPEIFIKLPSEGRWWAPGSIEIPENNELAIYPMTGNDEIMLKNADGLINGSTVVSVIQSCCPSIKNAWETPSVDIEYLFIAIRIASFGNQMDIEKTCEHCGETGSYTINLSEIIDKYKIGNFDQTEQIGDLVFVFKPTSYKITNLLAQEIFEQQRVILAANSQDLSLDQKQKIAQDSIKKLSKITVERMVEYIDLIQIPDGEQVINKQYIEEYIRNSNRKTFKLLQEAIDQRANFKSIPEITITCDKCKKLSTSKIEFDPANFFEADS